jgi:hypothetical protein
MDMESTYFPDGQVARPRRLVEKKKTLSTVLSSLKQTRTDSITIANLSETTTCKYNDLMDSLAELTSCFSILVENLDLINSSEPFPTKEKASKFTNEAYRKLAVYGYFEASKDKACDFLVTLEALLDCVEVLMDSVEDEGIAIEDVLSLNEDEIKSLLLFYSRWGISPSIYKLFPKNLTKRSFDILGASVYTLNRLAATLIELVYELLWKGNDLVVSFDKMESELSALSYSIDGNIVIQAPALQLAVYESLIRTTEKARVVLDFANVIEEATYMLMDGIEEEDLEIEDIPRLRSFGRISTLLMGLMSSMTLSIYNLIEAKPRSAIGVGLSLTSWFAWKVNDLRIEYRRIDQGKKLRPNGWRIIHRKQTKIKSFSLKIWKKLTKFRT